MSSEKRREERFLVQVAGRYRPRHGGSRDIRIKDLSEYGCRFHDRFSVLETGTAILVKIRNIGPIPAFVKWREASVAGVEFEQPLHPGVLDHIIHEMDEREPL
jgi:hypothetical protein